MAYERSGVEEATKGAGAILGLQQKMEEAAVRPRELEVATSLAESKAAMAKSQISSMQKMAFADAEASKAIQEANASGDAIKSLQLRAKAYNDNGMLEAATNAYKEADEAKLKSFETMSKAAKAQGDQNEVKAVTLRGLTSYDDAKVFNEGLMEKALQEQKEAPNDPTKRQAVAHIAGIMNTLEEDRRKNIPWEDTYNKRVIPAADSLSNTAQAAKKVHEENQRQKADADRASREAIAVLKANVEAQRIAALQNNKSESRQQQISTKTLELDAKHQAFRNKQLMQIEKVTQEQPTIKSDVPGKWFKQTVPNPAIAKLEAEMERADQIHKKNLADYKSAMEAGTASKFVPTPLEDAADASIIDKTGKVQVRPDNFTDEQWKKYKAAMKG